MLWQMLESPQGLWRASQLPARLQVGENLFEANGTRDRALHAIKEEAHQRLLKHLMCMWMQT